MTNEAPSASVAAPPAPSVAGVSRPREQEGTHVGDGLRQSQVRPVAGDRLRRNFVPSQQEKIHAPFLFLDLHEDLNFYTHT